MTVLALDAIKLHRFGLTGREPLLLMLAASLLTFAVTRLYTRLARVYRWGSGSVGDVHLHHMVVGSVLTLVCGMLEIAFQPRDFGVDLLAVGFGVGAAFVLDEFALWSTCATSTGRPRAATRSRSASSGRCSACCCSPASPPSASTTTQRSRGSSASQA